MLHFTQLSLCVTNIYIVASIGIGDSLGKHHPMLLMENMEIVMLNSPYLHYKCSA